MAAFAAPISGQHVIGPRKTIKLPDLLPSADNDHATVAINDRGDVFVAWQIDRPDLGSSYPIQQVVGVMLERRGAAGWVKPTAAEVMLLGNPENQLLGPEETCRKPDVVGTEDGFIVTWPRNIPAGAPNAGLAQLEAVMVRRVAGVGAVLDAPAPGQGYVVDASILSGDAGIMPDLVRLSRDSQLGGVVYAHETFNSGSRREYDLRFSLIDFGVSPPVITGPTVMVADVPMDDSPVSGAPTGGLVLPDVVQDDFGNLILAYEEYVQAGHLGSPNDRGSVIVRRFLELNGATAMLDEWLYTGANPSNRMRRPNLMSSRRDTANTSSVTWMEAPDLFGPDIESRHFELNFTGGVGAGLVLSQDHVFPNVPAWDSLPVPIHARGFRASISVREYPTKDVMAVWAPTSSSQIIQLPSPRTGFPNRPSVDVWEIAPYGSQDSRILPITYEGPGPSGQRHIWLVIHQI